MISKFPVILNKANIFLNIQAGSLKVKSIVTKRKKSNLAIHRLNSKQANNSPISKMSNSNFSPAGLLIIFSDIPTIWEAGCCQCCFLLSCAAGGSLWNVLTHCSPFIGPFAILASWILCKSSKITC